ncbi:peptide chain release factor-like protein [Candidatus Peregrinibacteria bacterium]|nr:peptide chain release factor-like protein [Candidatus Peregrinibacteria bacterium]
MATEPLFGDLKLAEKMQLLGLNLSDFEEKFVRGGGKGGQKINKSTNAVWLFHKPTGLDVKVQKFRELWGNRLSAYRLLVSKIEDLKMGKNSVRNQKIEKLRKQKKRRKRRSSVTTEVKSGDANVS